MENHEHYLGSVILVARGVRGSGRMRQRSAAGHRTAVQNVLGGP